MQYTDKLTDVHCHLLPYVDDGARNSEEALALLRNMVGMGVYTVYLTPHYRKEMFETPEEKIKERYRLLCEAAKAVSPELRLFLGREYYCKSLSELFDGGNFVPQTLGTGKHLLVEFSYISTEFEMLSLVKKITERGYIPIVAHIERYSAVQNDAGIAKRLSEAGAKIQINAESVLGEEGKIQKKLCKELLKNDTVDFIGSDAHRTDVRCPNLGECAHLLQKKLSPEQYRKIFYENPCLLENQ